MSNYHELNEDQFNEYLEENYIKINHPSNEFYECMGNHIWHIADIEIEWLENNKGLTND